MVQIHKLHKAVAQIGLVIFHLVLLVTLSFETLSRFWLSFVRFCKISKCFVKLS